MNSKRKSLFTIIVLIVSLNVVSQIRIFNSSANNAATGSSAFIDASTNSLTNNSTNLGKGIVYPRVDLTTFASFGGGGTIGQTFNYPTRYDGFVVYNTGTGNTLAAAADAIIAVTPGFWYYDNKSTAVKGGTWKPFGGSTVKNIGTSEIATSTSIDDAQVYAIKGEFTTLGVNALISITKPAGMTGYYKMTTYIGGKTFRSDISEFKMNPTVLNTDNVVTGNGLFSEVYPAGTYSYTLEFFK